LDGSEMDAMRLEANARRQRLAGNMTELSGRMRPGNLVQEAKDRAWAEIDRVTDDALEVVQDLATDASRWVGANRGLALGATATALLSAALVWYATRRTTVPLYAAYDMEESPMSETDETLSAKAADAWGKAKDGARDAQGKVKAVAVEASDRATGAYYSARSKAAVLSDEARERAIEAAAVAREKAAEAAEAARDAAEKARIAAGEAGDWARRQPQQNPAMVVVAALAAGALIGALLPSGGRRKA
jgi:hypothetical protein